MDDEAALVWNPRSTDLLYADTESMLTRTSRRIVVGVLACLALAAFALAIATFVLAAELADSSSSPADCPVRLPPKYYFYYFFIFPKIK